MERHATIRLHWAQERRRKQLGKAEVGGGLCIYLLQGSFQGSPRGWLQGSSRPQEICQALVAVKGVNTQVPTMDVRRGPPKPASNCGHRQFGPRSGFVFRVTPNLAKFWLLHIKHPCQGSGPFVVEVYYVLSRGVLGPSGSGFYLIWVVQPRSRGENGHTPCDWIKQKQQSSKFGPRGNGQPANGAGPLPGRVVLWQ